MLGACGGEPSAPPQAALVVRIVDGDTLVLAGGIKVRVLGIDAPEMERDGHPADFLAHQAKAALAELTLNRTIACRTTGCATITTAASWPTSFFRTTPW